ncbi:MAG TPA: UvrD-helicase domain-containing protein [Acidimicrobiales bacterium]|nr:UvrD-helicase domain-containing protein [Acidimicrobiales bacterium]
MTAPPQPPTLQQDEIAAEQAVIDHAYDRLEAMREQARKVVAGVLDQGAGGTHQARLERDVRMHVTERRLAELRVGDGPLCFGRTDHDDGERLYIGRLAVSDDNHDALLVDWRAPAAEPFYRATGRHPMGLTRRRHFVFRGRQLTAIDDELLGQPRPDGEAEGSEGSPDTYEGLVLMGEGALLAALGRSRTGRMGDIVATIQGEQDEVIRAPLAGILVVEGGPGSGKTAVALHRAAYLLYTHRFPLERAGVLLVGPNRVFLRYIEDVLPSLGEHTVTFATPAGLRPATPVRGVDAPATARVKGDPRMVEVVARAVAQRQEPLAQPVMVPFGVHRLTVSVADSARIVNRTRRRPGTHNERRAGVERGVLRLLVRQLGRRGVAVGDGARAEVEQRLREVPEFVAACDTMWPVLSAESLLHRFLGSPSLVADAGRGVLTPEECRVIERPRSARLADVPWTDADVALLDEALTSLGPVPTQRSRPAAGVGTDGDDEDAAAEARAIERALDDIGADRGVRAALRRHLLDEADDGDEVPDLATRTFGHVLVDEAQELSPMQWRMLARRCPSGSMTIVGDLGQATGVWAPATWDEVIAHMPHRREPRIARLTVNYRTPAEVMEVAVRVLAEVAPDMTPPIPVRHAGVAPVFARVAAGDLVAEAADAVRAEIGEVSPGKVGVVAPAAMLGPLAESLGPGSAAAGTHGAVLDAPAAVLTLATAKGLEFDSVVVVEPAAVVAESPQGLRALYVALTRTTQRLRVVHAEPLPAALAPSAPADFPLPSPA